MSDFGEQTWPQIRDAAGWVGLLPVGAIEAHGPHLPLATDGWIAEAMARSGAQRLDDAGVTALLLPVYLYTPAGFAAGFTGTVDTDAAAIRAVVDAAARTVGAASGALLVVVNAHFDPTNVEAIRAATVRTDASDRSAPVYFFDLTRRKHAERIGGEFATGACHAGRYEGSLMLEIRPDLVDSQAARDLPPYPRSLAQAIAEGATTFEELGGDQAYFGWPAQAGAAEGKETLTLIGEMLAEEVLAALNRGAGTGDDS